MKVIITVKTGKGDKSTESEIDKTVDLLEKIMEKTDPLLKKYKWEKCKCFCNGIGIELKK